MNELKRHRCMECGDEHVCIRPTSGEAPSGTTYEIGPITLDMNRLQATYQGRLLDIRPITLKAVAVIAAARPFVVTRSQIIERAWGHDFDGDERSVDVQVCRFRRALEAVGASRFEARRLLRSRHGFGYQFADGDEEAAS